MISRFDPPPTGADPADVSAFVESVLADEQADAYDRAVLAGLPLADALARRYRGRGIDDDDLTQVARLGLLKAVLGFRPGAGHGFAAYAVPTITGEIKRHFRDHLALVRPPRGHHEIRLAEHRVREQLAQRLGRSPSDAEVADALGLSVDALHTARGTDAKALTALGATAAGDELALVLERRTVSSALATLAPDERALIVMRFVDELSQAAIAERTGVSQMQVSRQLARLMRRLRALVDDEEAGGLHRSR